MSIYPSYPRIEIRSSSKKLVKQILVILRQRGFNVNLIPVNRTAKVYLSGPTMLNKWSREIGFSNNKNLSKIALWKKLGYYIPRTTHLQRLELLSLKKDNIKKTTTFLSN